jgi:EmrB/QacA subfamily drug resistance transporter
VQRSTRRDIQPAEIRARRIALLVAAALFMNLLDGTVIATALPSMAHAFGTSAVNLNIGITAYLLTVAVFIPASGWIAERFGARLVFGSAIGLFIAASIVCGFARSLPVFVIARIVQAVGGALMTPVGRLVVLNTTPKHQLMRAMSMMVWPALVAPILGPPIGGYVTTYLGWPWIFFLNVPLGVAAIVAALVLFPDDRPDAQQPFDALGFVLVGAACFSFMYGVDLIGQPTTSIGLVAALVGGGTLFAILAVRHLRAAPNPLLRLGALRIPTFAVSMFGGSVTRLAIGAGPFLLPLMFQVGFGLSAATSGLLVLWLFAGNLMMKPVTTPLVRRFGFRSVLLWNGLLTAASIAACSALMPGTPFTIIVIVLFLGGASRSLQFTALSSISFADVPPAQMSGANTLSSTVTQLSSAMSIALGALVLRASSYVHGRSGATPNVADFHLAFVLVSVVAALAVLDVIKLPSDAAQAVSRPAA